MKRFTSIITIMTIALISTGAIFAQKQATIDKEIGMFPAPKEGFKQVYIKVPAKKNESDYKIEVFVGKTQMVDCNRHFMGGTIEEKNLEGWGYTYYVANTDGNVGGTMMACPDGKLTKQFIHLQPILLRYNSRLPIVIYIPEGLEVNYKIWNAGKKMKSAQNGPKEPEIASTDKSIEDKRWKLVELNGKPVDKSEETHYIILHSENKRAEAKADCNVLGLPYELKGEFQIKFNNGISTMMACPPGNIEQEFVETLMRVDNFTTNGKVLSLNKARMAPLARFELVD